MTPAVLAQAGRVGKLGTVTAICTVAVYLVFQMGNYLPAIYERLNSVAEAQGDIMQEHSTMLQIFDSLKMELLKEVKRSNEIQRRTCENAANNDKEFRNCTIPE